MNCMNGYFLTSLLLYLLQKKKGKSIYKDMNEVYIMEIPAYKTTGLHPLTNEQHTRNEFERIKKRWTDISLDQAILIFEKAPKGVSLEEFAHQKQRKAEGYRNIFREYFTK